MKDMDAVLYYLIFVTLSSLLAVFVSYTVYLIYVHKTYSHIPGPKRHSFFGGHLPAIQQARREDREIHNLVTEWSQAHGPIYIIWIFHVPIIVLISPELVKQAIVTLNLPKAERAYHSIKLIYGQRCGGNGLVTEIDHEKWRRKRVMLNPAFHRRYLMNLIPAFNVICDGFLARLTSLADGQTPVDMVKEFSKATLDIIGKAAFGVDVKALEDPTNPLPSAIMTTLLGMQDNLDNPFWRFKLLSYPYYWKFKTAIRFLREYAKNVISRRQVALHQSLQTPKDILEHIVHMMERDPSCDMEDMVDNFLTFFIAGQETTAGHLSFTLFEIENNADIKKRMLDEIYRTLGRRRHVEYQDLGDLAFLGQIFKESLRLHPPIQGFSRITNTEITLDGYKIPANTEIGLSIYATQRFPDAWEEPDRFLPERFAHASDSDDVISGFKYLPFSIGPRTCIGKTFAQFESKVLMARLYQEFDVKLMPGQKIIYKQAITTKPRDGVWCTLKKKSEFM